MNIMKAGLLAAAALVSLVQTTELLAAAEAEPENMRLDEAWKDAMEDAEGVLTPAQIGQLNDLAYHSAVARVCDGFELHLASYAAATNALLADAENKYEDEQELARQSHILIMLGTAHGLFLVEGNSHKEQFCAAAAEVKGDKDSGHLWE